MTEVLRSSLDATHLDETHDSPPASLVSRRLHDFFVRQGLPRHKHSSQLALILGLSRSGAFRKFQDGAFSATDLQTLAEHFSVDIIELLSQTSAAQAPPPQATGLPPTQARISLGGRNLACQAEIGEELGVNDFSELVATLQGVDWQVHPFPGPQGSTPRHRVVQVLIRPTHRQLPRVAVLEDSVDLAANLKEAFENAGFRVELFTAADELLRRAMVLPFDAYLIDWWLNGQTSAAVIQALRANQSTAPLILTTGAIANGYAVEDDIVRVAMEHRVQVIEKPFRLALLISQVRQLLGEKV